MFALARAALKELFLPLILRRVHDVNQFDDEGKECQHGIYDDHVGDTD